MTIGFGDPFDALLRLQRALDTPASREPFGLSTSGEGAFPPLNVFQRGDDLVVVAELPGLDKQSLTVEVQRGHLRLAGQRPAPPGEVGSCHRRERAAGEFDRTVTLPSPVDTSAAAATYRNGILTVTLPHAEEAKPRTIDVG